MITLDKTLFPEWEVVDVLGEGSFGKVYLIRKKLYNEELYSALKIISIPQSQSQIKAEQANGMTQEEIREYFKSIVEDWHKEILFLDSLKGITNVVNIEDYKIVESTDEIRWDIYIRMEYVTNFNDIIANEAITDKEALKVGMDLCQALIYCQKRHILHRDIKPENIFRSSFGDYKLGDFGIARQVEKTNSSLSKKGTYLYMAPEVYNGKNYDARADIYSLGLVLYKLFNGNQIPFIDASTISVKFSEKESSIQKRISGEPLPTPAFASKGIADIILKACAFDPDNRYLTAADLFKDLTSEYGLIQDETVVFDLAKKRRENRVNAQPELGLAPVEPEKVTESNTDKTRGIFAGRYKTEPTETPIIIEQEITTPEPIVLVEPKKSKSRKPIWIGLGLVGVIAIGVLAFMFLLPKGYEMPNLVNTSIETINSNLVTDHFLIQYEYENDSTKTPGMIISQSIAEGSSVGKKQILIIKVATIDDYALVPNVIGLSKNAAKTLLEDSGFSVTLTDVVDSSTAGLIISQSVNANTMASKSKGVKLSVAVSPSDQVSVPNGVGKTVAAFQLDLDKLTLSLTTTDEYHDSIAAGTIISQTPTAESLVGKETVVAVIVSKGKAPAKTVAVPNGTGMAIETYKATLQKLGLKITEVQKWSDTVAKGKIISHNPGKNVQVDPASTITVVVSKGVSPWSGWVTSLPAGVTSEKYIIDDPKTQYNSSTRLEESLVDNNVKSGWTLFKEELISEGAWSAYTPNAITASITKVVDTSKTLSGYVYYRYVFPSSAGCGFSYTYYSEWSTCIRSSSYIKYVVYHPTKYTLSQIRATDSYGTMITRWQALIPYSNTYYLLKYTNSRNPNTEVFDAYQLMNAKIYYASDNTQYKAWWSSTQVPTYETKQLYRWKSVSKRYYFYSWSTPTAWQDTPITETSTVKVQTQTLYRYREK